MTSQVQATTTTTTRREMHSAGRSRRHDTSSATASGSDWITLEQQGAERHHSRVARVAFTAGVSLQRSHFLLARGSSLSLVSACSPPSIARRQPPPYRIIYETRIGAAHSSLQCSKRASSYCQRPRPFPSALDSAAMNNLVDCRDRTAEFFSTVQQIQRAQNSVLIANGVHASMDGTSHRPLPMKHASALSYGGGAASNGSSGSNGFHSEFDERPDEALLGNGRGSSSSFSALAPPPPPKQQSQFAQAAQHIGRSIHMVTEKLEKLGKCQRHWHTCRMLPSEV